MLGEFVSEPVDIYSLPALDDQHLINQGSITLGDLHGNAMKLVFMLIKHGVVRNINADDYQRLVAIYTSPLLKDFEAINGASADAIKALLAEFNQILAKMAFTADKGLVRLIGDEFADRGQNDYFTLKILEKLHQNHVPVEILFSNHAMEFITQLYEGYDRQGRTLDILINEDQSCSVHNLYTLLLKGYVLKDELFSIIKDNYGPMLRLVSYEMNADKSEINLYSHAPMGMLAIHDLAKKLGVVYVDATAQELANTIDAINAAFQQHLRNKTVHTLKDDPKFRFVAWNRLPVDRDNQHANYLVNFIHGHDGEPSFSGNICGLNNELGKGINLNQGDYQVLCVKPLHLYCSFLEHLSAIRVAGLALCDKIAAEHALKLHGSIESEYKRLINKKIDYQTFKKNCFEAIDVARPHLEAHVGWKQLLANLALAILGLGVFYLLAITINKAITGKFLFFQNDSAVPLDKLESVIHKIEL